MRETLNKSEVEKWKRERERIERIVYRYEYTLTREYNWNVKNKASKGYEVSFLLISLSLNGEYIQMQETYFFVVRPGEGIFYNEIETRSGGCCLEPRSES